MSKASPLRFKDTGAALSCVLILTVPMLMTGGCGETGLSGPVPEERPAAPDVSLERAILDGDDRAVYAHVLAGTPVNTRNTTGDTPLSLASVMGRTYMVEVLVGAGAELETKNNAGATPLFNAAFFCHPDALRVLIGAGADTRTTDRNGMPIGQIMQVPWGQIEPVYTAVYAAIGIPLDTERIESVRPRIAEMLR